MTRRETRKWKQVVAVVVVVVVTQPLHQRDISALKGGPLKLVDKFTYLGSSVSSPETDINTRLAKAWTATIGYRSYGSQTRSIKWNAFFPSSGRVDTAIWMHHMDANKTYGEKAWLELLKNSVSCIEQDLEATPYKTSINHPSQKLTKLDQPDMRTLLEK